MPRVASVIFAGLLGVGLVGQAQTNSTFTNPAMHRVTNPHVLWDGSGYLAAHTRPGGSDRIWLRKASSLDELKRDDLDREIFRSPEEWHKIWAPEIIKIGGRWYIYFSAEFKPTSDLPYQDRVRHSFVLESTGDDPFGPYIHKGRLHTGQSFAIDVSVFRDERSSTLFCMWNARNEDEGCYPSYIAPMRSPTEIEFGKKIELVKPEMTWEDGPPTEGPIALQRNGTTFVFYSGGRLHNSYALGLLINSTGDLLNKAAWRKYDGNPILAGSKDVIAPGHNGLFKSPDGTEDWIIYHARRARSATGEMVEWPSLAQRLRFNSDGLPMLDSTVSLETFMIAPSGE